MKHKLFSLVLCLGIIAASCPLSAETVDSGYCGENVTWTLDDQGVLTISGTGDMENYYNEASPWYSYRESISSVVIEEGVTNIGSYTFYACSAITAITIPNSVTTIEYDVFKGCSALTSITIPEDVTTIGAAAFSDCSSLTSISIPNGITRIDNYTFSGCTNLTSVIIPNSVTSIGYGAFHSCSSLTSITLPNGVTSIDSYAFRYCTKLTAITLPNSVTSIGNSAFEYCSNLTSVTIPNGVSRIEQYTFQYCSSLITITIPNSVTSIGESAFLNCSKLTTITIPEGVTSIGNSAFSGCNLNTIIMQPTNVPDLGTNNYFNEAVIIVPDASLDAYKVATNWSTFAVQIVSDNVQTDYDVTLTALDNRSALEAEITDPLLINVIKLKVSGTINGYDIMVIRNKMINLHELDLEDATIVANPYEYYTGCHSEDNKLGDYSFYALYKLTKLTLPATITSIGRSALLNCINLSSLTIPDGVISIGDDAFFDSYRLTSIVMPEGITSIGQSAFYRCSALTSITLPNSITSIGNNAFEGCTSLTSITIPENVTSIGNYAFNASFSSVYIKMVEPIPMGQYTFGENTFKKGTLYIPRNEEWDATYWQFYYDTQWSQFVNLSEWDPTFSEFNIDNDYDLDGGTIQGEDEVDENGDYIIENGHRKKRHPRGDFHAGCGFMVDNTGHQHLRCGHLTYDETKCGSLIGGERQWNDEDEHDAEANLIIDTLFCDIEVIGNRWYFFSFPFDVDRAEISAPGNHVFREYDGAQRATNNSASGNWKAADNDHLYAGKGYIFQCDQYGTLSIPIYDPDFANEAPRTLEQHAADNAQNAHWNFVGNPYTSYYELEDINYDAPITVWNGYDYEAIRPGDDDYTFRPFEAYFVQQPDAQTTQVGHDRDKRETYNQSQERAHHAAERRAMQQVNPNRLIVNLTITDGEHTDKTRIVYNDAHTMDYELNCDASKFLSTEPVPQIYTTHAGVNYSINERAKGSYEAQLGIRVPADGSYTIAATRLDVPLLLEDHLTGITHNLTLGGYVFSAEAGYSPERFSVRINSEETGIADFLAETGVSVFASEGRINLTGITDTTVSIFSVSGQQVTEMVADGLITVPSGTYLVQAGDYTTKVLVK